MSAKAEVLARVRAALEDRPPAPDVPRGYRGPGELRLDDPVGRFCERVGDYRATVHRVERAGLEELLRRRCAERGATRIAVPAGAPWRLDGVELVADDPPLAARALDELDGVLSGCAVAIAETGTIVLDGTGLCGRRALTLVPDLHLCVVGEEQIAAGVPDGVAAMAPLAEDGRPLTLVSGPSATSDIELERVEGVHGPRTLEVFVVSS